MPEIRSVLITGANRGIGAALTTLLLDRGVEVVASSRSAEGLDEIARTHAAPVSGHGERGKLSLLLLDVEAKSLPLAVKHALERVDGLVNNAGWGADLPHGTDPGCNSILDMDPAIFQRAIEVNMEGARRLMQVAVPAMRARNFGRIVNVSSVRAALNQITGGVMAPAYGLSKLLLNGLTALAAHELRGTDVLVNCLCPGWCQTRMGGPLAHEAPEVGAHRISQLLFLPQSGPSGKYFIDGKQAAF